MRVIAPAGIKDYSTRHRRAKPSLEMWLKRTLAAEWESFADLRRTFPAADGVQVASGKTVIVFNIGGNDFRLIAAVHFNTKVVFVLRFMTHAEYDKNTWKDDL